jgi:uncharacterized protein
VGRPALPGRAHQRQVPSRDSDRVARCRDATPSAAQPHEVVPIASATERPVCALGTRVAMTPPMRQNEASELRERPRGYAGSGPGCSPRGGPGRGESPRRGRRREPPAHSSTVGQVTDTDTIVERILTAYDTITVVGASAAPAKAAHFVPAHMQRHGWRIIPVNPHADAILGEHVYRGLRDVPGQIGLVNVFRPPGQVPDIARQAVAAGATALWLQLGIASQEARAIAGEAGLLYVEDRCLIIEQRRLRLDAPGPR